MGRGRIGTLAAIVLAGSSLSHCVGATEIMVDLRTDVACSVVATKGVTIATGDGTGEPRGIVANSKDCDGGAVGTIALTPSGDVGGLVALRVVLGVNSKAEDCSEQTKYSGCIVARRSLRYVPHTALSLPIDLDQDCLDNPCGPESTCVHGSCTDAGTICENNTCGIDAGAPDAGSCADTSAHVGDTDVAATPHIARASKGYAIAWVSNATIYATIMDANGQTVSPQIPLTNLAAGGKLDAVAIDTNDQDYLVVYEDSAGTHGLEVSTAGVAIGAPTTFAGASGPIGGAFWDATQSVWVTAGLESSHAFMFTIDSSPNVSAQLSPNTVTGVAVSRHGSTYYATTNEGAQCILSTCTLLTPNSFSCSPNTFPGVAAMRAAADATHVVASYVSNGTLYFTQVGKGFTAVPDGPVDDLEAMVPLVVGATPYRIVWRTSNVIVSDTFPTRLVAAENLDASGYTGAGAGFDAVADDPSKTGYAVVYYKAGSSNGSIHFLHRCK